MITKRFNQLYTNQQKISMLTCYDACFAHLLTHSAVDAVLVGDSVAMVVYGDKHTVTATETMLIAHTRAVASRLHNKPLVADLPFLSYRKSLAHTCDVVHQLMQAGAHAIKLEGAQGNLDTIQHLVESGIPIMGHLGLTPQHVHRLGGHTVQGKNTHAAEHIKQHAQQLQAAGCFALVLECIPHQLASHITANLTIPTIGIGAGPDTSGQILVLHDMLGLNPGFQPKFLKTYCQGFDLLQRAVDHYVLDIKSEQFPTITAHSYEGEAEC